MAVQPTLLNNQTCIYCGIEIDRTDRTKEHVIGRRFIPKGSLNNSWNLIAWSCLACNHKKSTLEDDISAITLRGNTWMQDETQRNDEIAAEAVRKSSNSYSARTGKRVSESDESLKITLPLGPGVSMTLGLVAPPQIDTSRIDALARYHLLGFFYLLTYDEATKRGKFPQGSIFPIVHAIKSNWGNPEHRAFMGLVLSWDTRLIAPHLANGNFKVAIRKHPGSGCFAWAMEWNQHLRIAGFFGDETDVKPIYEKILNVSPTIMVRGEESRYSFIEDSGLHEGDDTMFSPPPSI